MTVRVIWKLNGMEKYLEALYEAGKDVEAAADRAVAAAGAVLLEGMKQRVPVLTGNLKSNLECSAPMRDGYVHYVEVGIKKDVDPETARYGNVQEYGSAHTPPHSYIRATFDEDEKKARKAERESLKKDGVI